MFHREMIANPSDSRPSVRDVMDIVYYLRNLERSHFSKRIANNLFVTASDFESSYDLTDEESNAVFLMYKYSAYHHSIGAMLRLALIHERGELGRIQDIRRAIHYYGRAAEMGEPEAEFAIGKFYMTGVKTALKCSPYRAMKWLMRAALKDHEGARILLDSCANITSVVQQQNVQ